jgi:hypothetical protein
MLEVMMSRFHVTFSGTILTSTGRVDRDAIDRVTDEVLDELLLVRDLIDPDAGATMSSGSVEFMMMADAATPEAAVALVAEHLRRAVGAAITRSGLDVRVELEGATAIAQPASIPA